MVNPFKDHVFQRVGTGLITDPDWFQGLGANFMVLIEIAPRQDVNGTTQALLGCLSRPGQAASPFSAYSLAPLSRRFECHSKGFPNVGAMLNQEIDYVIMAVGRCDPY